MRATKRMTSPACNGQLNTELRRGPWTLDEDNILIHYITCHGEGRWNSLAKLSGLKRTGKSCRLRWLNYLKPDVKHGNLTPQEQLLILELHSKLGNRWSKIAQHLPGRTDNEIKNYWRTKVQKQACHLKLDSNSKTFLEALRQIWLPRLLEKVEHSASLSTISVSTSAIQSDQKNSSPQTHGTQNLTINRNPSSSNCSSNSTEITMPYFAESSLQSSSYYVDPSNFEMMSFSQSNLQDLGPDDISKIDYQSADANWMNDGLADEITFWNMDELWQFKK